MSTVMKFLRSFPKFFHLSRTERLMVIEAACLLGLARMLVITLPFRWVAKALTRKTPENEFEMPQKLVVKTAWAISRTSLYTPWKSNCLAKAIAGKYMLRRRRISNTLYLGVAKDEIGEFEAHAWLKCGETIITGGNQLDRYAIVAVFDE